MTKKEIIINRIKDAFKNNPSGFTLNQNGVLLNINKGYAYSITNNFNKDFNKLIEKFFYLVKTHKAKYYKIGGWFDNGLYYLDISYISNKKTNAINKAIKHNQLSIFCFNDFNCINTNVTFNKIENAFKFVSHF